MRFLKNKKGNFPDVTEYLQVALLIGFVLIIAFMVYNNFDNSVQSNPTITNTTKLASTNFKTGFFGQSDYFLPFIFLGFLAFSVVSARLIPSSNKLIIIPILALVFLPLLAMIIGNVWDGFSTNTNIASNLTTFTWTKFFLDNLVVFTLIYSFVVGVALVTKEDKTL